MSISFNDGISSLSDLYLRILPLYKNLTHVMLEQEESLYSRLASTSYLIEELVQRGDTLALQHAKELSTMLDTLLREGDNHMANEVFVGAIEAFTFPSERPHLSTKTIAEVMPPTLRAAYLEEMGEAGLDTE